jgi:hypothetical protein
MSDAEKNNVLIKVAKGSRIVQAGNAKVRMGNSVVHVRYCSANVNA